MFTPQELTDRLVVSVEESDVVFVIVWVMEMKDQNCLSQAINAKHFWKGCSAVSILVRNEWNCLRKINLELLLLCGADGKSEDILNLTMEEKNLEALKLLILWDRGGKEEAVNARHLLSISLQEAADWIDSNLPPPPNHDSLTGTNPLPPAPASLPPSSPLSSISGTASGDSQAANSSKLVSNGPKKQTCLRLDSLPRGYTPNQVALLFKEIQVEAIVTVRQDGGTYSWALVEVPTHQAMFCFLQLNKKDIGAQRPITCNFASRPQHGRYRALAYSSNCTISSPSTSLFPQTSTSASPPQLASSTPSHIASSCSLLRSSVGSTSPPPPSEPQMSTSGTTPQICLKLDWLPRGFSPGQIISLFSGIGVDANLLVCQTSGIPSIAFVDVPFDQAMLSISKLNKKFVGGHQLMTCAYGTRPLLSPNFTPPVTDSSQPPNSLLSSSTSSFQTPILTSYSPPSFQSTSPLQPPSSPLSNGTVVEHNLLILRLPLVETPESRNILLSLPSAEVFPLPEDHQSVAFVKARSLEEAEKIKSLWNKVLVNGKFLEVKDVEAGLSGKEVVEAHLGAYTDQIRAFRKKAQLEKARQIKRVKFSAENR